MKNWLTIKPASRCLRWCDDYVSRKVTMETKATLACIIKQHKGECCFGTCVVQKEIDINVITSQRLRST